MLNLVVIFVEYDLQKYAGAFERLRNCLEKMKFCHLYFIIVDNKNEGDHSNEINNNTCRIGGDNTAREFSGWQKGIDILQAKNINYDAILFSNEAFNAYGINFIENNSSILLILKSIIFNAVIGKVDSRRNDNLDVFDYHVDEWVRTNCFIVPKMVMGKLGSIITVTENDINTIIRECYEKKTLLTSVVSAANTTNGHFTVELDLPEEEHRSEEFLNLRIDTDKFFQTPIAQYHGLVKEEKPVSFRLEHFEVNGKQIEGKYLESGWYQTADRESHWLGPMARLCIPRLSSGRIKLYGYITPEILRDSYHDRMGITISTDSGFFHNTAPISKEYQHLLIEWLTVQWHSKINIEENWDLFRVKVRAILNEALLTARMKKQGVRVMNYNLKRQLEYNLKNWLIKVVGACKH